MSISSFIPSFLIKPSLRSPWLSGHKTGPWHTPGLRAPPAHHLVSSPPPHLPLTHTPGPRTCLVPSGPRAFARAGTATWKMPSPSPTLGVRLEERICSQALELAPGYALPCAVNHCLQHLHLQVSACRATRPLGPVYVTCSESPAPSTEPGA